MNPRRLAAVPEQARRVVLYVRVSSLMGRGGDDFHSPDMQISAMRRATAGMREVGVIDDDIDQTGRTFSREGIEKIRNLVEAGAVDALAVYNISRFGRNVLESLKFLNWLADRGVTILSATEHIDTSTPSGRWMLTNMLAIAEMRSDEIGGEWSRTISQRAGAGKHHGRPPTGYVKDEGGRLVPDPVIGPAVADVLTGYADGGENRALRARLQALTGLRIHTATLKNMLRNRTYLGIVHVRGQGGLVEVAGAHQPLIDVQTWERIQVRLARDSKMPARVTEPKYALSGLARCGLCDGPANHRPDKARRAAPGKVRVFCGRRWDGVGPDRCAGCGAMDVELVEAAVLERLRVHLSELRGDVGAHAARLARASRAGLDAASVEAELGATRRAMAKATERWAREQLSDDTYEATMKSLRDSEGALAVSLAGLRETAAMPEPGQVVALGERLMELWPRMNGGQRNRALRDLVERVVLQPAGRYRQPPDERVTVIWR